MTNPHIETIRRAYEGFAQKDLAAVLTALSPDVKWDATDALAHTGVYHGHEGVLEYLRGISGVWEEFELEPEEFLEGSAEGSSFIVLGVTRGRLKETGEHVEARFAHIAEVKHGKVVKVKICLDRAAAERHLLEKEHSF